LNKRQALNPPMGGKSNAWFSWPGFFTYVFGIITGYSDSPR
jgi:hypothetical protein